MSARFGYSAVGCACAGVNGLGGVAEVRGKRKGEASTTSLELEEDRLIPHRCAMLGQVTKPTRVAPC